MSARARCTPKQLFGRLQSVVESDVKTARDLHRACHTGRSYVGDVCPAHRSNAGAPASNARPALDDGGQAGRLECVGGGQRDRCLRVEAQQHVVRC